MYTYIPIQCRFRSLKQHSLCLRHEPQTTDNTSSANSDDDKADEDSDQSDEEDDDEDDEDDEDDNALKPEEAKTNPFLAA